MASWREVSVLFSIMFFPVALEAAEQKLSENTNDITQEVVVLEVDKSRLKADLRTWPEDFEKSNLLMSFRIAIGKEEGDKQREGDNKTPEGIYFVESQIDGSALPAKYGARAIPINFPNPHDKMLRKTGHGIWLHGVEQDQRVEQAKVTEGCVAFYNADIMSLSRWLKPFQGIILVSQDGTSTNRPEDLKAVRQRSQEWLDAWKNRELDRYVGFYDKDKFVFNGMKTQAFGEYKGRVFKSYKEMKLETDSLRVLTHPKYAMTVFNQDFNGDNRYISKGRKILYWGKDEAGNWNIIREVFENRRIEMISLSAAEIAKLSENSPSRESFKTSSSGGSPNL